MPAGARQAITVSRYQTKTLERTCIQDFDTIGFRRHLLTFHIQHAKTRTPSETFSA